jgi:16S rRNA (guanine966-N2)-methyltransferase
MRIIAGAWRGRALRAPPGLATRPTAERLRQAVFDMLAHAPWRVPFAGLVVLDAFAGTGAMGLEALSRGAAHATFMETDRAALAALRANIAACQADAQSRVLAASALAPPPGAPCGLVFLDPPYGQALLPRALAALAAAGWLAPGGLVIAESARREEARLPGTLLAERTHGAGRVQVLRQE